MKTQQFIPFLLLICCCAVSAQTTNTLTNTNTTHLDPIQQASDSFKEHIGFRTKEAEMLFPFITNGMPRIEVERLLGRPKKYDGSWAAEAYAEEWNYSVFYSQHLDVTFKDDRVVSTTAVGFADRRRISQ